MKKSLKIRWIISIISFFLAAAAIIPARLSTAFADWYAFTVYPFLQGLFSRISGVFPFSLGEIIVIAAVIAVLFGIVYFIIQLVKSVGTRRKVIHSALATTVMTLSLVTVMFVYNCGVNYYRSPFSAYSGLSVEKYSKEEVREVLEHVIISANFSFLEIETAENGSCILPDDCLDLTTDAMKNIAEQYPVLNSYYPHAKPVLLSKPWCYTRIVGVFTPFSMEANYNTCNTTESIGHTICHELSHLTGFMREDEANFIAYLACRESGNSYLRYSGYFHTMCQLLNAYHSVCTSEEYGEIYSLISPGVSKQITLKNEYWSQFETPVAEVSSTINDTYLKANNQTDGEKSYGRMVDLVIADYFQNVKES